MCKDTEQCVEGIKKTDLETLLEIGDGQAALLYIYLLKNSGKFDRDSAAGTLRLYPNEIAIAYGKLQEKGLFPEPCEHVFLERPDIPPEYTSEEIAKRLTTDAAFKYLIGETERRLGKLLSASDLTILFGIYDYLGFPAEVASLLITFCVEEAELKYGGGRMPTMRQIEKTAYTWAKIGIDTEAAAIEFLKKNKQRHTVKAKIMKLLQITGRALSASENKYLDEWIDMGFGSDEIYKAYDITVIKTGGLRWQYMNSIIKNWNDRGLKTLEQIDGDKAPSKEPFKTQGNPPRPRTFPTFIGEHEKNAAQWLKQKKSQAAEQDK